MRPDKQVCWKLVARRASRLRRSPASSPPPQGLAPPCFQGSPQPERSGARTWKPWSSSSSSSERPCSAPASLATCARPLLLPTPANHDCCSTATPEAVRMPNRGLMKQTSREMGPCFPRNTVPGSTFWDWGGEGV